MQLRIPLRIPLPVLAAILLLALTPTLTSLTTHNGLKHRFMVSAHYAVDAKEIVNVQLTIVKENKTILYVKDDPVTFNWMKAVISTLLKPYIKYPELKNFLGLVQWTSENGATRGVIDTESCGSNPVPYIEVGTGNQYNTPTVNKLAQLWMRKKVEHWSYAENGTMIHIHYQATFTASEPTTVREVGLSLYIGGNDYLLVSYYHLDTPIELNASDAITVNYDIYIHKQLPFTDNFYRLLALYMLGYKAVGGVPSTITTIDNVRAQGIDTGYDYWYHFCDNRVDDNIRFIYDSYGFNVVNPLHAFMIGDNAGSYTENGYVYDMSVVENPAENSITVTFHLSFDFPSTTTVYGVALIRETSINSGVNDKLIMLAYFPLPSPVTVPANGGLGLEVSYTIKAS